MAKVLVKSVCILLPFIYSIFIFSIRFADGVGNVTEKICGIFFSLECTSCRQQGLGLRQ